MLVFILFVNGGINLSIIRQSVDKIAKEDLSGYIDASFKETWEKMQCF